MHTNAHKDKTLRVSRASWKILKQLNVDHGIAMKSLVQEAVNLLKEAIKK